MSKIETITPATLKDWMDKGEAVLVDVREQGEYNAAHIKGSVLVPVGTCSPSIIPHDPSKKLVFHCKVGRRGHMACETCARAMPEDVVYNLAGGIDAWIAQGYPVEVGA